MKKSLIFAALLTLCACSDDADPPKADANNSQAADAQAGNTADAMPQSLPDAQAAAN